MPDDSSHTQEPGSTGRSSSRGSIILIAIAAMVAVSGFFMGLRQSSNFAERTQAKSTARAIATSAAPAQLVVNGDIPTAPRYSDLPATLTTPNKDWVQTLASLPTKPTAQQPGNVIAISDNERESIMKARASRRAYDGAPPTVPHAIDQSTSTSCVVCHGIDAQVAIDDQRPPVMSHGFLVNCIQCHVPASGPIESLVPVWSGPRIAQTSFAGTASAGPGSRAYPGAPPTMPHPSAMRENCMSCHDAGRPNAIRTTHAERSSCRQCHAPSAALDRRVAQLTGIRAPLTGIVRASEKGNSASTEGGISGNASARKASPQGGPGVHAAEDGSPTETPSSSSRRRKTRPPQRMKASEESPIGLPDLNQAELDEPTLRALFRDIGALTRLLAIIPKQGARSMVTDAPPLDLDSALERLLAGNFHGLQIRYEFGQLQWWDSLLALPGTGRFRLVRISHDPTTLGA